MLPHGFEPLALIPLLPLIGATLLAVLGAKMPRTLVTWIALSAVLGSFILTVISTSVLVQVGVPLRATLWSWIAVGRYDIELAFALDQLSAALLLVVTGVGFLIHVYSTEYMADEPSYWRYFAYLNLFIFAMSVLVLGASLPVMFIGWEGVGLASYLLIGFWFSDIEKAAAGKKAFITNRVGDFGFLLGMFVLFGLFGTGDFRSLAEAAEAIRSPDALLTSGIFAGYSTRAVLTAGCLFLFIGATGKSAQIPLYVWLPDAMAGPTPVSALIHAATMVTSGIYMCSRLGGLFNLAPEAAEVIAWVGGLTALGAATVGLAQNDIKKVLAYSTVSQLGYMFIAVGMGAYAAAMFHVVTHAFFKACLFLGSGVIIHALHGEQDMRQMGGLAKKMPLVYWTFLISTLALAGIPPLSGFFSKDTILAYAFQHNKAVWAMGFLGAGLTALYMMRLVSLTFYGELRGKDHDGHPIHLHLPHWPMKGVLLILAIFAAVAGFANLPHVIGHPWFDHYLAPVAHSAHLHLSASTEYVLMAASVGWAATGLVIGYQIYKNGPSERMAALTADGLGRQIQQLLYHKWYVDELYQAVIIKPLQRVSDLVGYRLIDKGIIDSVLIRGAALTAYMSGRALSLAQNGRAQTYAMVLVGGVGVVLMWLLT